jgi:ribosome biogenesis protein ENP2
MAPYKLGQGPTHGEVTGCNAVDINPAHGLLAFGTEGAGVVELWDQRARRQTGTLSITTPIVMDASLSAARRGLPGLILPGEDANEVAVKNAMAGLNVSALCSSQDGLNLAVGTSTGHVLLYDLRMDKPYATKDQGFSLPIKSISWPGDPPPSASAAHRVAAASSEVRDTVLSADAKGIKVWPKSDPTSNLASISPQSGCDLNDVHHLPGSGLVFAAVEGTQCAAWYVPTLGPAPKWCSFLDRITDEIDEEQASGGKRGVYEDFKFVDRAELERLDMGHLIGSNALRPYMHGYFVALPLYERARLIANPSAYSDAREKAIQAKLDKKAESRIRSSGAKKALEGLNVQVNKDLAQKAAREQERLELEAAARAEAGDDAEDAATVATKTKKPSKASLLGDDRFKELFTNPEFQVDQTSREYALLHPSSAAVAKNGGAAAAIRRRTAVEEEEDESDRESLDPDQEEDREREERSLRREPAEQESDSSDDEGGLGQYDPREHAPGTNRYKLEKAARLAQNKNRGARLVDDGDDEVDGERRSGPSQRKQTFEGRLKAANKGSSSSKRRPSGRDDDDGMEFEDGGHTMTFTPSGAARDEDAFAASDRKREEKKKKAGLFGAGMSKGSEGQDLETLGEADRHGRKKRRDVNRSASKNQMRR